MIIIPKKGDKSGYFIECEICGKTVYQTKTQYSRAKHHFCSTQCQQKFRHLQTHEIRTCEVCGKEFEAKKKVPQRFCSISCQHEWQKSKVGIDNVRFQGEVRKCDWCDKEIVVGKSNLDRFSYHFCSSKCRQLWYSAVYSQTDEWKDISRKRATRILSEYKFDTNTKPQVIINNLLDEMNIKYINEYNMKYYAMDNYLQDYNLSIEVMGDYWHTNPLIYKDSPINEMQQKRVTADKRKHTYVYNYYNHEILYLWESDIYNNLNMCKMLIQLYIKMNGILENYNSFNYHIFNDMLALNSEIIYPYFQNKIA